LAQSQGNFILELIRTDHCHLEAAVAQQGHFGVKSTVQRRNSKRYSQNYIEH